MAQVSDVVLDNQGFASFRTELNNIIEALNSGHIGSSTPASAVAGTIWVDNGTSNTIKIEWWKSKTIKASGIWFG